MTKKHFIQFAEYINNLPVKQYGRGEREGMAEMVCKIAIGDNPKFNKGRFLKACGLDSPEVYPATGNKDLALA